MEPVGDCILLGCGKSGMSAGPLMVGPVIDSVSVAGVLATGDIVGDRAPLERPLGRELVAEELFWLALL